MANFQQILEMIRRSGLAGPLAAIGPATGGLREDTAEGGQGLLSDKNIAEAAQRVFTGIGNLTRGPNTPQIPQATPLANEIFQQPVTPPPIPTSGVAEAAQPPQVQQPQTLPPQIQQQIPGTTTSDLSGGQGGMMNYIKSIAPQLAAAGVGQIPGALPMATGFSEGLTEGQEKRRTAKEKSEEEIAKRVRKREEEKRKEELKGWEESYSMALKLLKPDEFGIPPTEQELREKAEEIHRLIYEGGRTTLSRKPKKRTGTLSSGLGYEEV